MTKSEKMTYWDVREAVIKIIPRHTKLLVQERKVDAVREKGRKRNYQQFNLKENQWKRQERLLNAQQLNSFLEIALRAPACPMPFNMDVWDGLICPFKCTYCYANAFRASLYTAFFDNSKTMGFRHCNPEYYKQEMAKMDKLRALPFERQKELSGINKAYALEIPLRMGIRFEDFLKNEAKDGISLAMLQHLSDIEYPVMLNTKSDLVGTESYLKALAENKAGTAIHLTLITSDEEVLQKIEPGAPSYKKRMEAMRNLVQAGVRVVARIEPYLFLLTDRREDVERYLDDLWDTGVRHITFDTYSYTAYNPGIRQGFINAGYDFDRLFLAGCDSQPLGSLLLGKFMELFRDRGFSCSTFDMGNVPDNDQSICCEVGDMFGDRWNYGCTVMAARYIQERSPAAVTWQEFSDWVDVKGGFLSNELRQEVHALWNLQGNVAYSHRWAKGLTPRGYDENGLIWTYDPVQEDYREQLLKTLISDE